MGYTSAQGNTAYVSDAMPAASLNLYTSNDFDFDPACFTELNMLNLELARRDLDAARERVAAMGCADAPAGKVALATVLLGAGQPEWARRTVEEATAPAWIERISPLDDQALADRYMLHKLLGMPDAALADAMELQRRQARKSGRPDPTTPTASPTTWRTSRITCRRPRPRRGARSARPACGPTTRPRWAGYAFCAATPPAGWIC